MGTQISTEALKVISGFVLMLLGYYVKAALDRKEKDRLIDVAFVKQEAALESTKMYQEGKFNAHDIRLNEHERRITKLEK